MIISASRRCDIPAYAMDWLLKRLEAGYCLVRSPFDARAFRRVSLLPEEVDCLVFWTRDPRPLLGRLPELEASGIPFYVQMTITGYPASIEPAAPELSQAIGAFSALSERIGPRRLRWRYDPLFVAASGPLDPGFQLRNFGRIAAALEGRTERVTVSLLDEYQGTRARLEAAGLGGIVFGSRAEERKRGQPAAPGQAELFGGPGPLLPPEPYPGLLAELGALARAHGILPQACAEPYDLSGLGIEAGPCVDRGLVEELSGRKLGAGGGKGKDRGQRGACHCAPSVDIGAYGSCRAGCVYCYARRRWGGVPGPVDPEAESL